LLSSSLLGFKLPGAHDAGQPAQPATSTLNVFFDGKNALDTFHDWAAFPAAKAKTEVAVVGGGVEAASETE